MTFLLSVPASPAAPIACDLTGAQDTLPGRLAEYRRLFDEALVERTSRPTEVVLRFTRRPGIVDRVVDLARREAACCPFLAYDVRLADGHVVWTITGGEAELSVIAGVLAPAG